MKPIVDIDSLRTEHESDEQWEVRRNFMEEHRDDFEEGELITLAQLFTNIEFLGCRYVNTGRFSAEDIYKRRNDVDPCLS